VGALAVAGIEPADGALTAAVGADVAAGVFAVTGGGSDGAGEGGVAAAGELPAPGALVVLFAPCAADTGPSGLGAAAADFAVGVAVVAGAGVAAGALVAAAGAALA